MYCPKCGQKVSDEAVYCEHCGTQLYHSAKDSPRPYDPDDETDSDTGNRSVASQAKNSNSGSYDPNIGKGALVAAYIGIALTVGLPFLAFAHYAAGMFGCLAGVLYCAIAGYYAKNLRPKEMGYPEEENLSNSASRAYLYLYIEAIIGVIMMIVFMILWIVNIV